MPKNEVPFTSLRPLLLLFLLALSAALAQSQPKRQDELPKALLLARYAYVQALDGGRFDLRLIPEDRQAIFDVEDALHTWHRYSITLKRHDADLVFVVRKGRIAGVQGRVGVGGGNYPSGGQTRKTAGLGAEVGSPDDLLYVYTLNPDGSLQGPIWKRYLKDGLDTPDIPLFKQFKTAVEAASAKQSSPKQPPP